MVDVVVLSVASVMIFAIQSANLATFVNTPGRPTGQPFAPNEVIPIRVALPSTFLIKPPEIIKISKIIFPYQPPVSRPPLFLC